MRKTILLLSLILSAQLAVSQRSEQFISPDRLYKEAKTMYDDGNYAGCIDKINQYKKQQATDPVLIREAGFLLAASAYKQGRKDAANVLKDFLDTYPETIHRDEVCFMIGSAHFERQDYNVAIHWFERADIDNISPEDQENYAYRMAFSCLKSDKKEEARRLFGLLRTTGEHYRDAATYYSAYIDYSDGKYNDALPLFNQLRNNREFQPDVSYHIAQSNFIQGRYSQTIKEGTDLLNKYSSHAYNPEINRIVGVSYYKEADYSNAANYLLQYASSGKNPQRNDLYLLGMSYYNQKDYKQAVTYLVKSDPSNDALGQNAYLYLGQSYLNTGDEKNALMAFESASRLDFDPQAKETAMYNYAMLLHKNSFSAFGESVTVLEHFLNTYPKSIYADRVNDCLVDVYLTTKNYDTALRSIEKIKNPGRKILEAKQKIYFYQGTVAFTNVDYPAAVSSLTKAIGMGDYAPGERDQSIYWRAESYYKQDQYDNAIKDYNAYLNTSQAGSNPGALAYYGLGYCYFKKAQYSNARNTFNTYINKEKNHAANSFADAYARLGDCYFDQRLFADAESAYSKSVELQPSLADYAAYQKGYVMGLQKNYKGKVVQMDQLISSYPDSRYAIDALYEKGRAYVMLEDDAAAIQTFEKLLAQYPQSALARKAGVQTGLLYFNRNDLQKSATAYKKVIESYPGTEEARVAAQDLKSVYVDMNNIQEYAEYVNSRGGIERFEVPEQDSLTYLSAEKLFLKGDETQAQAALSKYLQQFPEGSFSVNAHNYLGAIHYNRKDYAGSKSEYEQVISVGNTQFLENALLCVAEIQYNSKDYKDALANYQRLKQVAASKPNEIAALLGIMRSGYHLNDYAEILNAASAVSKESAVAPEVTTESRYYKAKACLGLKETQKALPELMELAKDTRTVHGAEAKYLLAQAYYDTQEPDKAEKEALDYIRKGTPHAYWLARGFILLSDVYVAKDDHFQARQYLESLQHNYKNTDDDIHAMIQERLGKIK
ncbi:MAG: tetratricopeptide repeat protein [Dysgonamonadaceae bacterium]|jgi:TolA-binding protein|nr:tetratricopeptide repeat protein [Dysgonamonadaceae bacterium]